MKFCLSCGAETAKDIKQCPFCKNTAFANSYTEYLNAKFGGTVPQTAKPAETEDNPAAAKPNDYPLTEERIEESVAEPAKEKCEEDYDIQSEPETDENFEIDGTLLDFFCGDIKYVRVPDGVERINDLAFSSAKIEKLYLPESVSEIGDFAFEDCAFLEYADASGVKNIQFGAFERCEILYKIKLRNGVCIGEHAFEGCENLYDIDLSCASEIGAYAFYDCKSLEVAKTVNAPAIEDYTFCSCDGLQTAKLSDKTVRIGDYAFCNCAKLKEIFLPASLESIGSYAFSCCHGITDIFIPIGVENIGKRAFNESGIRVIYCEADCPPVGWHKDWNVFSGILFAKQRIKVVYGANRRKYESMRETNPEKPEE